MQKDYKWTVSGKQINPTRDDLELMVGNLAQTIEEQRVTGESISVESGKLLIKNSDGHTDIWVWAGEIE